MAIPCDYRSRVSIPLQLDNDASNLIDDAPSSGGATAMIFTTPSSPSDATGYPASRSDQRLVLAAQSGCKTAFNELWNLYSRRVFRTIFSITKNTQDAEDVMQDTFLRAFVAFDSFEGRSSFYSWLTRIAINSALGILRKRRSRPEISFNSPLQWDEDDAPVDLRDLAPDPEQTYDQRQRRARLLRAIHRLPTNLREAVQALLAEECSVREVADRLNISEAAAKSRLYRARTRLCSLTSVRCKSRTQAATCVGPDALPA